MYRKGTYYCILLKVETDITFPGVLISLFLLLQVCFNFLHQNRSVVIKGKRFFLFYDRVVTIV